MNCFHKLASLLLPTKRQSRVNPLHMRPSLPEMEIDDVRAALAAAEAGDVSRLFELYRQTVANDGHVQTELGKRKLAVLRQPLVLLPYDKAVPEDVALAAACQSLVDDLDDWFDGLIGLLDSVLWPVSVAEKVFAPSTDPGRRYDLIGLKRVDPELMDFSTGCLRLHAVSPEGTRTGETFVPDPARYVIHRGHLLTTPDNWGGPMRPLLFWHFFSHNDALWWARFLDRYGAPFIKATYANEDLDSRAVLEGVLRSAPKLFGITVSEGTQIELVQAATSQSGDAYEKFFRLCNEEKSKIILGQFGTTQSGNSGMNSSQSSVMDGVREDYADWDKVKLSDTIKRHIFRQWSVINALPGRLPRCTWGGVDSEAAEISGDLLTALPGAGLRLTDAGVQTLSERLGLGLERAPAPPPEPTTIRRALSAGSAFRADPFAAEAALSRLYPAAASRIARGLAAAGSPDDMRPATEGDVYDALLTAALQGN